MSHRVDNDGEDLHNIRPLLRLVHGIRELEHDASGLNGVIQSSFHGQGGDENVVPTYPDEIAGHVLYAGVYVMKSIVYSRSP